MKDVAAAPLPFNVKIPAGLVPTGAWSGLADLADEHAGGLIHLNNQAGVQLFGVDDRTLATKQLESFGLEAGKSELNPARQEIGWLTQSDGSVSLGAAVQLGVLTTQLARMIDVIGAEVLLTEGHSLIIRGLDESIAEQVVRVLAPLGLIFDENSPWLRVSSCAQCQWSLSDVRRDAASAVTAGHPATKKAHFLGCEVGCGRPHSSHTEYLATGDGEYEVSER
ncbi:hypothetical protein [Corynebacterium alimapuense]|uniref:Nitrite/Sulfite reductase ferredoxin-like domain-containing protein n=1 Tax=Corynebacterium alimapuense TaxID=1576874 RepID=A0A3M8K7L5_9CORY|nr:hypothetical protein [Corynebacterium alimapuense]RNE49140.1 hypothetical protein C5L39_01760 [Corynebacterium alimapuense]